MEDQMTFKNLKIDFKKLEKLGFTKTDEGYQYKTKIIDNQFFFIMKIQLNNMVSSDVIEISTNEKFMPYYVKSATGEMVGTIRKMYDDMIEAIQEQCCVKNVFQSEYAKLIIEYVEKKYKDELEYLWEKFPDNAIWRNPDNKKWYGALLVVEQRKIGIDKEGKIEIIDLLMEPEEIESLVDHKTFFAGYHMNKKHWITVKLDGSVDINKIYEMIDHSYDLAKLK